MNREYMEERKRVMRKVCIKMIAVFAALAMLQGCALGEAAAPVREAAAQEASVEAARQSSYVFRPKVCSVWLEEIFSETMCETWFNLVDAVMAGEDTFACPDQDTYDWVMGQFPIRCFPVLTELIDYAEDREHSVVDGVASFTYRVPREEAARRIDEFARQVEGILNAVLEDDFSDFEKELALYDYFARTYTYDYETEKRMYETYVDYTTTYRLFETGTGICSEVARAYSYLLMQAGVDATTVMGGAHEWSCVRLSGVNYHVDPTFALDSGRSLAYFMMTDDQREATGFGKDGFVFVSNYAQDHPHPDYTADDDTFAPLWERQLEEFFPREDVLRCWNYTEGWERNVLGFDYSGY